MSGPVPIARPEGSVASLDAAALLDAAARLAAGCLILTDVRGRILWCDEAVTRAVGLPAATLIGRRLEDLGHVVPVDRDRPEGIGGARPRSWIHMIDLGPAGGPVLDVTAVPVVGTGPADPSAVLLRVVAHRTPTDRRAALRPVVEAVHADVCPVAVVGSDDRILYANLRWTDLFATRAGDPVATPASRLGPDATASLEVAAPEGRPAAAGQRLLIVLDDVAAASIGVTPGRRAAVLREEGERHRRLWADLAAVGSSFGDRATPPPGERWGQARTWRPATVRNQHATRRIGGAR